MVLSAIAINPITLVIGLVGLAVDIFAIVDVFRRPDWVWQSSGQNKTLWAVLTIVGLFICSLIVGLVYLLAIRPKLAAAQSRGEGGGGFDGSYGGSTYGGGYGSAPNQYGAPAAPGQFGGSGSPGQYGAPAAADPYSNPAPSAAPSSPPPGWYPDPSGSGQPRYWDGRAWAQEPR